ncbi:MAG: hypothetical protein HY922_16670 [Elusimicrobia bacterium]|nr:hypothetical protein [Elusimicrobiota bacterium]
MTREIFLRIQIPRPVARLGLIALLLFCLRGDLGLATQQSAKLTTYYPDGNGRFLSLTTTGKTTFAKTKGNTTLTGTTCTGFKKDQSIGSGPRYIVQPSGDCNNDNQVLVRSDFAMPVKLGAGTDTLGSTRYAKLYVNGDIKADRLCWKDFPPDTGANCIYDWPLEIACLLTVKKCVKSTGACKTTPQTCSVYINNQIEISWKLYNSSGTKTMFTIKPADICPLCDSACSVCSPPYITFDSKRQKEIVAPEPVGGIPPLKGDKRTTSGTGMCNTTPVLNYDCVYTQDYDEGNSLLIGVCTIKVTKCGHFTYGFEFIPPPKNPGL